MFHVEKGRINTYYFGEDLKSLHKGGDGMFDLDELIEDVPTIAHERHHAGGAAGEDGGGGKGGET